MDKRAPKGFIVKYVFIGAPNTTDIRNIYQNYMTEYNFEYGSLGFRPYESNDVFSFSKKF